MVPATDAITLLATWVGVRCRSARTSGISGASPNQPKKQRKKANHVMWKARICGDVKSNRRILSAFMGSSLRGGRGVFVEIAASLDGHQLLDLGLTRQLEVHAVAVDL